MNSIVRIGWKKTIPPLSLSIHGLCFNNFYSTEHKDDILLRWEPTRLAHMAHFMVSRRKASHLWYYQRAPQTLPSTGEGMRWKWIFISLHLIEIGFVFCDWKGWSDPIELARFYFSQGKHEESLTDSEGCETVNGVVYLLGIVSSNSFLCERGKIERERDSIAWFRIHWRRPFKHLYSK